jgi:Ca2+-transporting ATPase
VAVNAVIMIELFYVFSCRSLTQPAFKIGFFSNQWVFVGVAGMLILQLLFTYVPLMNQLFSSAPISLQDWGYILAFSLVGYLIVKVDKWLRRK